MRRPLVLAEEIFEEYHYTSNAFNVDFYNDVFVTAGRPYIAGQNWRVIVDPGVVIGSNADNSTTTLAELPSAYAARTGVFPRILHVVIYGRIQGKGGDGGDGQVDYDAKNGGWGGGGGGGAGAPPGQGGLGDQPPFATDGDDGSSDFRSDGGLGYKQLLEPETDARDGTSGKKGTGALYLDMNIRLSVLGEGKLWAGGGGGGGGKSVGVQGQPYNRWGGYGGSPGRYGGIGGDGLNNVRYDPGGSGHQPGQSGKGLSDLNQHTVTVIQIENGSYIGSELGLQ